MKRVYTTLEPTAALLLADLLEQAGIPAGTRNTKAGWLRVPHFFIWAPNPPSVWIMEDSDLERATRFVEEFSRRNLEQESAAAWLCDTCGERIEGQFDACWKCSAPIA